MRNAMPSFLYCDRSPGEAAYFAVATVGCFLRQTWTANLTANHIHGSAVAPNVEQGSNFSRCAWRCSGYFANSNATNAIVCREGIVESWRFRILKVSGD